MPAGTLHQPIYAGAQGGIHLLNVASLYKPGELGQRVAMGDGKVHQVVQCDSGPTAVAAGDLAFWFDRDAFKVTNKLADSARNSVAGIFTTTVTPGNFCSIQIEGPASVKAAGGTYLNRRIIANSGSSSDCISEADGTYTYTTLGIAVAEDAAGFVDAVLSIGAGNTVP